jgi:hypothetical protein
MWSLKIEIPICCQGWEKQPAQLARWARCIPHIWPVFVALHESKKMQHVPAKCVVAYEKWIGRRAVRTWMSLSRSLLQSLVLLSYNYEYYYYYGVETATWLRIENAYRVMWYLMVWYIFMQSESELYLENGTSWWSDEMTAAAPPPAQMRYFNSTRQIRIIMHAADFFARFRRLSLRNVALFSFSRS